MHNECNYKCSIQLSICEDSAACMPCMCHANPCMYAKTVLFIQFALTAKSNHILRLSIAPISKTNWSAVIVVYEGFRSSAELRSHYPVKSATTSPAMRSEKASPTNKGESSHELHS
ncbi:hypothetical protein E2P81_ATG00196 [Venturia nashicola]|uniref:Uncharacterized protein n=1 Tax=Venturia nashicola TaxID=86259 RepID=A0A4Z1PHV3_9PEZI|nr:hypothetical protein E6O75_ATG00204 [Venturia nashicola]TLD39209.1 hypothetical protein E2P81_ATG00196 [Venturia nashicola]